MTKREALKAAKAYLGNKARENVHFTIHRDAPKGYYWEMGYWTAPNPMGNRPSVWVALPPPLDATDE